MSISLTRNFHEAPLQLGDYMISYNSRLARSPWSQLRLAVYSAEQASLRLSIPSSRSKNYSLRTLCVRLVIFGRLSGIEPELRAPQAPVLTVTP
jgi:hypothetical protein